jgi:hypothetical protein
MLFGDDLIEIAAGDFNGDGDLDLAALDRTDQRLYALYGRGDASFDDPGNGIPVAGEADGGEAVDLPLARIDGDELDDLMVVNYADGLFSEFGATLLGRRNNAFSLRLFTLDFEASALALADFDGAPDGGPDAIAGYDDGGLSVNLDDGGGEFQAPFRPIGTNRVGRVSLLATADLNGDARPDLLVLNRDGDELLPLLNRSAPLCPGDCNADDRVTIDELTRAVSIALGDRDVRECPALERDGQGGVSIDELIAAVFAALDGCAAEATAEPF